MLWSNLNSKKFLNHETYGLCDTCGLDASLHIHEKCGGKSDEKKKPIKYKDKECKNLDCLKIYTPTAGAQKLCPECSEIQKTANKKRHGYY